MAKSKKEVRWEMRDDSWYACFTMSLKGGDLPKDFECEIDVEISFKGAQFVDYRDFIVGGSSGRVTLQSMLRKQPMSLINRIIETGLEIHVKQLNDPNALLLPEDRAAIVVRYIESLPDDVRDQALKDLGLK